MGRSAAVACVVIVLFALGPSVAAAATASFVATPSTARVGQEVVFDASLSTGIPPLHYTWDFGDDEYVDTTRPRVSHVYTERGTYTVELEVEDDEFEFATAQRTVTVADEFGATAGPTPSEIARAGLVTAGAFYSEGSRNVRLKVARDGVTVLNVVFRRICRFCSVEPAGYGRRASIRVRDLDADTDPEVVVDLYTGGAHCCFYSRIFAWDSAAGAYLGVTKQWSDTGYRMSDDGDGVADFSTADARFAYVFASFAESFFPIRVLHFVGGRMRDVTRVFNARVRRDAGRLWRYYIAATRKQALERARRASRVHGGQVRSRGESGRLAAARGSVAPR